MKIIITSITGVIIIEPRLFSDERGYFFESFNQKEFEKKVCKKFGKGGKIALSLHPLKRNEGDETRGRQVQVVAAF